MQEIKVILIASRTGIAYYMRSLDGTLNNVNPDMLTGFVNALVMFSKETIQDDIQSAIFNKIKIVFQMFEEIIVIMLVTHEAKAEMLPRIMKQIKARFLEKYQQDLTLFSIDFSVFQSFDSEIDAILASDQYLLQEGKGGVELYKPEADFISLISKIGGRTLNLSPNPRFFLEENAYYADGGHVKRLSLFKRGLQALPDSLGNLSALETLVLSRNNLAFLPDRIGELESLKELIVDNNQLTNLSQEIGSLTSLEFLNVMWNRLTELPDVFTTLKNLKMFLLGWNRIQKLPISFQSLNGLEHLDLSYNRLTSFPTLPNFDQLVYLNLEGNVMSSLDFNIDLVKLPNLMVLNLKGNRLFEVPSAVCEMDSLEVLNLEGNRISKLPENICSLDRLKELSIQNNPISELSGSLKSWIHELEDRGVKVYREGLERF